MLNLQYSYDLSVDRAYIVTIKNHEKSEAYSKRCQESCEKVGMNYMVWDAYDGTQGKIIEPDRLIGDSFMSMVKVSRDGLPNPELCCALSHVSLWSHCAAIDRPIVILEHDAVMVKKFEHINTVNSIVYLGGIEWASGQYPIYPVPLFGSHGPNDRFLLGTHAYAIDPMMAKNLLADVLRYGIWTIADRMLRCDLYNITHQGLYAYNDPVYGSTIKKEEQ
jgi:hypothetical protein